MIKTMENVTGSSIKRVMVVVIAIAAMTFLMSGTALANWGPHGGYGEFTDMSAPANGVYDSADGDIINPDTDACAGCHRAHTAVSEITWQDGFTADKNALLIGTTASTLKEFCYTCHGDAGSGAATNVQSGTYDGGPSGTGYATDESSSAVGNILNGGGFEDMGGSTVTMSSTHDVSGAGGLAWGGGADGTPNDGPGITIAGFDCASCHDPHGSSNYRILKDEVNGVDVGGYSGDFAGDIDPDPQPFVISNEKGFPIYTNPTTDTGAPGFRLHRNYGDVAENPTGAAYEPDYTEAKYARMPTYDQSGVTPVFPAVGTDPNPGAGMSGWCAACHTTYNTTSSSGQGEYNADGFDPTVGYGDVVRHRHPVNVALDTFAGDRDLIVATNGADGLNTPWGDGIDIPLEHDPYDADDAGANQTNTIADDLSNTSDNMGCLTCHRAHGTDATMEGYADSFSNVTPERDSSLGDISDTGVPPALSSVLLRADNRGVCERCHNK